MRILDVVYRPSNAFASSKENPSWVPAFLVISFSQFLLIVLQILIKKDSIFSFESAVLVAGSTLLVVGARNLIAWVLLTLLLYYLMQLSASEKASLVFKSVFSIVVHSHVIILLGSFAAFIVSLLRWMIGITPVFSMKPLVGMNALGWIVPLPQPVLIYLQGIDPFTVWFVIVVSQGLRIVSGLRRLRLFLIVLIALFLFLSIKLLLGDVLKTYLRSIGA